MVVDATYLHLFSTRGRKACASKPEHSAVSSCCCSIIEKREKTIYARGNELDLDKHLLGWSRQRK